ncbi:MAG: hypothetical protein PHF61_09335 [Bacteroidales bacterium]|jgi:hypothetical protein|nr:hypothetical protein [Bacteroidales bacterium]MDD4431587.1 hypothetical protein [Bacteroidales bacterium]
MNTFLIIKVRMVRGNTLYPTWQSDMQIVTTNEGDFIDNPPGLGPFDPKWIALGASPGFDWNSKIGEEVTGVVRKSRGHKWLNKY